MCAGNDFSTKLQCTKATSTDSSFGTFSPSLSLSTFFFVLPDNFIVSGVNSSNLYPGFILKTILFPMPGFCLDF